MDIKRVMNLCTAFNMCLVELYEDANFYKIPKCQIEEYVKRINEITENKLLNIKKDYDNNTKLIDICKSKGVTISIIDKEFKIMNISYRAEIYYEKKQINIMKNSIADMYEELKDTNISMQSIIDIHIAHELYHLLEYTDNEKTEDLVPEVTSFKIGRYEKKAKIVRSSEAAAHIFCMKLLGLSFHPKALDYIYLISKGEITEDKLEGYILKIRKYIE